MNFRKTVGPVSDLNSSIEEGDSKSSQSADFPGIDLVSSGVSFSIGKTPSKAPNSDGECQLEEEKHEINENKLKIADTLIE